MIQCCLYRLLVSCNVCLCRRKFYGDDLAEDQIALARAQGAFTLSNPLTVGIKDEGITIEVP